MTISRSIPNKVGDWQQAYVAIRDEITPPIFREKAAEMEHIKDVSADPGAVVEIVRVGVLLSRLIMANDRMAALTAAIITSTGVKPVVVDTEDGE